MWRGFLLLGTGRERNEGLMENKIFESNYNNLNTRKENGSEKV
jgi:hypothetical protein